MRPLPRRRWCAVQVKETTEPLAGLKRRCAGGATVASTAYLATLTTVALGPPTIKDPVAIGLLMGFGTVAGLCALGAMLTWAVGQMPDPVGNAQAQDIKWAIRFGEDLADAFRSAPTGSSRGR